MQMLRINSTMKAFGYVTRTSVQNGVREGLITRPVRIGERSVAWPDFEISAIVAARIAGCSTEEIRQLVNQLHSKRAALLPEFTANA